MSFLLGMMLLAGYLVSNTYGAAAEKSNLLICVYDGFQLRLRKSCYGTRYVVAASRWNSDYRFEWKLCDFQNYTHVTIRWL